MPEHFLFFVYGQLMSGGTGFQTLGLKNRVKQVGPERIAGRLFHLGDYPGLMTGRNGIVHGELLAFEDPAIVEELDAYELYDAGNPAASEFCRIEVALLDSGGRAWAYEYNRSTRNRPVIATGNWQSR